MEYKRATKKLRAAGIDDIIIVKGLWGPYPENVTATEQASRCFSSWQEAVQAVLDGFRPRVKKTGKGKGNT